MTASTLPDLDTHVLTAHHISKSFGGVRAVKNVSLMVAPGTCHAVVGENGAGKSTLMRVLSGELEPSSGVVSVDSQPIGTGVQAAQAAGVAMVHQELSLVPHLTVAENIVLGAPPTRYGFIRANEQRHLALEALARVGVDIDPQEQVEHMSLAARQFVELAKALYRSPKVLILDEPTASLTPQESDALHALLRALSADGIAIVYISHRLQDVLDLCKSITVLRDGDHVADVEASATNADELVRLMVGTELSILADRQPSTPGDVVLRATGVTAPGVIGASIDVRRGEVVGVGGVVGAGRTEWIRAIIGLDPRSAGDVSITDEQGRSTSIISYSDALRAGVGYVPEDRREEGLSLDMTVEDNIALPSLNDLASMGLVKQDLKNSLVDTVIRATRIKAASTKADASSLSGGNQQKIVFGKWLPKNPKVMILDEPTRGVDVGAKAEIHRLIDQLVQAGTAVLLVSSDLPELLALSDRIVVLAKGEVAGILDAAEASPDSVIRLATVGQKAVTESGAS